MTNYIFFIVGPAGVRCEDDVLVYSFCPNITPIIENILKKFYPGLLGEHDNEYKLINNN